MHIVIGYRWFPDTYFFAFERAFAALGHKITYVGLPHSTRCGYDNTVPVTEIIAALPHPPDLYLWIDPGGRYFPPGIEELPVPTACYLVDVHLGTWRQQAARFFDVVFIAQKNRLNTFKQSVGHKQVYWLPLAAVPDIHKQLELPKIYDVGFVGNIVRAHRKTARPRRLKQIAKKFQTNDFYKHYRPKEVNQIYSQSHIVFNTSIAGDVTLRLFEGTACGALVLTDETENGLPDLFDIGREIVTYQDDADLLDKIAYYLAHEKEKLEIAKAGQERTLAQHTCQHRVQAILETVTATSFKKLAPMRKANSAVKSAARQTIYTHLHMLDAILDETQSLGINPIKRASVVWPCLIRRLLL